LFPIISEAFSNAPGVISSVLAGVREQDDWFEQKTDAIGKKVCIRYKRSLLFEFLRMAVVTILLTNMSELANLQLATASIISVLLLTIDLGRNTCGAPPWKIYNGF
jgi:hypothetical protein